MSSRNCAALPAAPEPARPDVRDLKVLFVAEQFVPPVYDGSTTVYESWLRSLRMVAEVYGIFFTWRGMPDDQTHAFLRNVCRDYLILPGHANSTVMKTVRALGRFCNGSLFAPALVEEFGRWPIQRDIAKFLARNQSDVALISKLECVYLLGRDLVAGLRIPKIIDLHDDFVKREQLGRQVLRDTLLAFPELAKDRILRNALLRQRLSRLSVENARRQERRLLGLFDRILISSHEEYLAYSARDELSGRCVHAPWPIHADVRPMKRSAAPEYDAGVIAAYNAFNFEGVYFLLRKVLPLIHQRRPGFRLLVAGNIQDAFNLTDLSAEGVEVVGPVKDLSSFYGRVKVCVVPVLNGTGVSLKALEALHRGLPVVATSAGARGLVREDLPNLHVADTPAAFAEAVLSLLDGHAVAGRDAANRSTGIALDHGKRFIQICREVGAHI